MIPNRQKPQPGHVSFLLCLLVIPLLILAPGPVLQAADMQPAPGESAAEDSDNGQNDETEYLSLFRRMFFSTTYNSLRCYENVYFLLEKAKENGLNLANAHVIFIFDKDYDKLLPSKPADVSSAGIQRPTITMYKTRIVYNRSDPPGEFRFHAVVAVQDKIMDFDYTNSPKMMSAAAYCRSMFTPAEMRRKERNAIYKQLTIRVIPAEEYLYYDIQHPSWYLFDLATKFPSQSMYKFIRNTAGRQGNRTETAAKP